MLLECCLLVHAVRNWPHCRLTIFVVYNAYPARTKTETWEKRLSCISWVFGCYKTMMQQVNGRQE